MPLRVNGEVRSLEFRQVLFGKEDFCGGQEHSDFSIGAVIRTDGGHINDDRGELFLDVENLSFPIVLVKNQVPESGPCSIQLPDDSQSFAVDLTIRGRMGTHVVTITRPQVTAPKCQYLTPAKKVFGEDVLPVDACGVSGIIFIFAYRHQQSRHI